MMRDDMENHRYQGDYTSALRRARKVLKAAGFTLCKTHGRYSPFGGYSGGVTYGVNVSRLGCSNTIAVTVWVDDCASRDEYHDLRKRTIAALRAAGLPFDDRGWLDCV